MNWPIEAIEPVDRSRFSIDCGLFELDRVTSVDSCATISHEVESATLCCEYSSRLGRLSSRSLGRAGAREQFG